MNISLVIPPLVQLNTPYPAVPVLARFLRQKGHSVHTSDLSLALALKVFTPEFVRSAAQAAKKRPELAFFCAAAEDYAACVRPVVRFLQGKDPTLATLIARRGYLPEGPIFTRSIDPTQEGEDATQEYLGAFFGMAGTTDLAKYLASLFLDDLAAFLASAVDPNFGFGKYAERIAVSLPEFTPLYEKLHKTKLTPIEQMIDDLATDLAKREGPDFLGLSIPFPGTLYSALRIAAAVRRVRPGVKVVLGGGYVNSELRDLEDERIFDFVDALCYDEGFQPWMALLDPTIPREPAKPEEDHCCGPRAKRLRDRNGFWTLPYAKPESPLLIPDYQDLPLDDYLSVIEMPNPMHRIWSDGLWLKLQLAQGCYWHKCAFCDLDLDYIGRYAPAKARDIADAMVLLRNETGRTGFHFTDEALAPALVRALSEELIRRGEMFSWWGNIRFDRSYTPELASLMARAGCIAVSGGLECAEDRLLSLMNKGITTASAKKAFQAFREAGIEVHAYLMYGFPTETEAEALHALRFVRDCFAEDLIQSAYWHRFALTAHSAIAQDPARFGIRLLPDSHKGPRFAHNEIPFEEPGAPDWDRIGKALKTALFNYMLGTGFDIPPRKWLAR
ncbi:MAG: radical SAM protein [Victivallales bacterium]|nr:radical SAM protein [Victivallales bacterium]